MPLKVLVVAAWGYPPAWSRCVYRVNITHKRFRDFLIKGVGISEDLLSKFKLESCCSTIAILALLSKSKNLEAHTIIFGLDSVINPSSLEDRSKLREVAREKYRVWFDELARESTKKGDTEQSHMKREKEVEFVILPGVGNYYGWRFEGSVDHLFLKAYHAILRRLSSDDYKYVAIDLTHGINFQTISVLYALIAASLTLGKEEELVLLNSEPALAKADRCIKEKKTPKERTRREPIPPQLSILDVTKLQSIIKLIRIFRNVTSLNPLVLSDIERELAGESKDVLEKIEKLIRFTNLLANGVVALTYPNTYCIENGELRPLGKFLNPCIAGVNSVKTALAVPEYLPIVNEASIKYEPANAYEALDTAIPKILEKRICSQLLKVGAARDLVQYLNNTKELLGKKGHFCLKLVINRAKSELNDFTEYVIRCISRKLSDGLCKEIREELEITDNEITVPSQTLRKLYENKAKITDILKSKENKAGNTNKEETLTKNREERIQNQIKKRLLM